MPSKIATHFSTHKRSTPLKQCQPQSLNCLNLLPQRPTSPYMGTQRLPCGCLQSHVLIENIDKELQEDSSVFSITTPTTPITSIFPSARASLYQNKITRSIQSQYIWPYSGKFHYYLPHISSSSNDFYTSQEDIAYDIPENFSFSYRDTLGTKKSVELPLIRDDDFQYYPRGEMDIRRMRLEDGRDAKNSLMIQENPRKTKMLKKKSWEGPWLKKVVLRGFRKLGSGPLFYTMPYGQTISKLEGNERHEDLILDLMASNLPSDQYAALRHRQKLESLYGKRSSFSPDHTSRLSAMSPKAEDTRLSYSHTSRGNGFEGIATSSEQRLKKSEINYATRKALEANWDPNDEDYYNDHHIPQSCIDDFNKLWNDESESDNTNSYTTKKKRGATQREDQLVTGHEKQRNRYDVSDTLSYVEHSYGPVLYGYQSDASVLIRPVLQSKFSWSDSGSEDVEETSQTSKCRSFFGDKKRKSNDSGYSSVTGSSASKKSFRDTLRSFSRR